MSTDHVPVLAAEVLEVFAPMPDGTMLDATLGRAGHAEMLLDAHPRCRLVGVDRDGEAISSSSTRLERFGDRVELRRARFDEAPSILDALGVGEIVGALFDLGVSSPQLDDPSRGFSHRLPGQPDMRMDQRQIVSAATITNESDEAELAEIIARYGDQRFARRIARAIVAHRPVTDTVQLGEIIKAAIPAATRRTGGHPAATTFQAIRIAVNDELEVIEPALRGVAQRLCVGGRLAVISFHSGEDRIVKRVLNDLVDGGCTCPPRLPCACGATATARRVRCSKHASAAEVARNPRSRSARLRVVEAIPPTLTSELERTNGRHPH